MVDDITAQDWVSAAKDIQLFCNDCLHSWQILMYSDDINLRYSHVYSIWIVWKKNQEESQINYKWNEMIGDLDHDSAL